MFAFFQIIQYENLNVVINYTFGILYFCVSLFIQVDYDLQAKERRLQKSNLSVTPNPVCFNVLVIIQYGYRFDGVSTRITS